MTVPRQRVALEHAAFATSLDRPQLAAWYLANRSRTQHLFSIFTEEAYYERPIPLRNPIVFYEGHIPAFAVNTLIKLGLGRRGIDEHYERLFERGIDPESEASVVSPAAAWPRREEVQSYARAADELILDAIENADLARDDHAVLKDGQGILTVLEHELMHQETFGYMVHNLPHQRKVRRDPPGRSQLSKPAGGPNQFVDVGGKSIAFPPPLPDKVFGWDNERSVSESVHVPMFGMQRFNVTNAEFLEFVESGGYGRQELWSTDGWEWVQAKGIRHPHFWRDLEGAWFWRGMFEDVPLPPDWPVWVTHAEASAFARWRGASLPTELQYAAALQGRSARDLDGNFDFGAWDPVAVGSFAPVNDIYDLVGNGWEWTADVFAPHDGTFRPMSSYPLYSSDFFDGKHYVLKGASPLTARELVRPSFRNWFRAEYPYVFASFRLVT